MPSEPDKTHLLIVQDDQGRRGFILEGARYSIGRDPDCDIRLASQFVSRHHALIVQHTQPDGSHDYRILDGRYRVIQGRLCVKPSANGLMINGRKLIKHTLQDQDEVVFGPKISATYRLLKRDPDPTVPPEPDEFDITLIHPGMVGDPEDLPLLDELLAELPDDEIQLLDDEDSPPDHEARPDARPVLQREAVDPSE